MSCHPHKVFSPTTPKLSTATDDIRSSNIMNSVTLSSASLSLNPIAMVRQSIRDDGNVP